MSETVRPPESLSSGRPSRHGHLGLGTGTALSVGAVLGPGALTLASAAAAVAGPASLLAWLGLVAVSLPIALVFAALGARHPDGGGVSAFVQRAFGPRPAAPVGWWFYWAVPLGVPAAALIGGEYVASAAGLGRGAVPLIALLVLAAAWGANLAGLRLSGRLQLLMIALLTLLLGTTIALSSTHMEAEHFTPFLPQGWASVGSAAAVLFFAFAGWEAISHLSAEFAAPGRDLPRATVRAWGIVATLYGGLALVTIGVLGAGAGATTTPLTLLLERSIGTYARPVTAVAALLLTFGAVNTYLAGGARLGAALGQDGAMPRRLVTEPGGESAPPRRSLTLLTAASMVVTAAAAAGAVELETLLRSTSACLAAVTLAGLLAAATLLPRGSLLRTAAVASAAMVTLVLTFCGPYLLLPAALAATAYATREKSSRKKPSKPLTTPRKGNNPT
ncbi:APC family permease [Streptomyces sp. NPDC002851]